MYGGGNSSIPLKRFPDSSVSSLIRTGWRGRASHHQKLASIPMGGWLADGIFFHFWSSKILSIVARGLVVYPGANVRP